jgi:chemotaxis-related protein WspB
MLLVLFNIGTERFGLDAQDLVEILPAVALRPVYGMPTCVVGLLLYQATLVPIIDVSLLATGQPCERRLSTRILLTPYRAGPPGACVGLRVDGANDAENVNPADFITTGLTAPEPPYFGAVLRRGLETVQLVKLEQLLPEAVRACLFVQAPAA